MSKLEQHFWAILSAAIMLALVSHADPTRLTATAGHPCDIPGVTCEG